LGVSRKERFLETAISGWGQAINPLPNLGRGPDNYFYGWAERRPPNPAVIVPEGHFIAARDKSSVRKTNALLLRLGFNLGFVALIPWPAEAADRYRGPRERSRLHPTDDCPALVELCSHIPWLDVACELRHVRRIEQLTARGNQLKA